MTSNALLTHLIPCKAKLGFSVLGELLRITLVITGCFAFLWEDTTRNWPEQFS
jgi:hypothetical protein